MLAKSIEDDRKAVGVTLYTFALAIVLLSSLIPCEATAGEPESYWPMVPPVQWVHPNNRIAILCEECTKDGADHPGWILRLGSLMHREGLELVVVDTTPEPGDERFLAILDPQKKPQTEPPVEPPVVRCPIRCACPCAGRQENSPASPCGNPCRDPCCDPCSDPCRDPCCDPCWNPCACMPVDPPETHDGCSYADEQDEPRPIPRIGIEPDSDSDSNHTALASLLAALAVPVLEPRPVRILMMTWRNVGMNRRLFEQASWMAHYAKLDADFVDVSELYRIPHRWLQRYDAVVLASSSVPLDQRDPLARMLESYLEGGGNVAVLAGVNDDHLMSVLGVRPVWKPERKMVEFSCEEGWYPGAGDGGFVLPEAGPEVVFSLELEGPHRNLCQGLTAAGETVPLAVLFDRANGRVFYWNGVYLTQKLARGLILLGLMELMAPIAAGMMDAMVFYVDDTPRPLWDIEASPVKELYGKTDTDFYMDIWWPQIQTIIDRYRLRPTFAFILSFNDQVVPPFKTDSFGGGADKPSVHLARTILSTGYEVAIQGYNNQSFSVGKSALSVGWPGKEVMEDSLRVARREMIRILNSEAIPTVYVAPGNFVQKLGKEAVLRAYPEVSAIATIYQGWKAIMGSEFAPDPMLDGVMNIPRVSAGYGLNLENRRELVDALVAPGVFSHFIRSDDIYDPERSPIIRFEEMVHSLDEMLKVVTWTYPFLRRMPASRFAEAVKQYETAGLEVRRGPGSLVVRAVDAPPGGITTFLRLPPGHHWSAVGCELLFQSIRERRTYVRVGATPCEFRFEPDEDASDEATLSP